MYRTADISSSSDIKKLVDSFYQKLLKDDVVGHFFTEVVKIDFDKHMPVMYDFWATVLLDKMSYRGNVMVKHIELNKKSKMELHHFERWLNTWNATVDELYEGKIAEKAKKKATLMKELMIHKVRKSEERGFVI